MNSALLSAPFRKRSYGLLAPREVSFINLRIAGSRHGKSVLQLWGKDLTGMLWFEFLTGLDKLRSDIRAGRSLQAEIEDADPILNTFRSLIVLQPLPEVQPEEPNDVKKPKQEGSSYEGATRALQVGEVQGYVKPRETKFVPRAPVLEDGEDALAGEEGDE